MEAITPTVTPDEEAPAEIDPSEGVLDWDAAVQRVGGRADLLRRMVKVFLLECGKLVPGIRLANDEADKLTLRRLAHSLKGSADTFAAHPTVEAALRLELMERDGDLTDADEAFDDLRRETDRLTQALAGRVV